MSGHCLGQAFSGRWQDAYVYIRIRVIMTRGPPKSPLTERPKEALRLPQGGAGGEHLESRDASHWLSCPEAQARSRQYKGREHRMIEVSLN